MQMYAWWARVARLALGKTQEQMAEMLELSKHSAWTNYERGTNRMSLGVALDLQMKTGVLTTFIYKGSLDGIKPDLAAKLRVMMRNTAKPDVPPHRLKPPEKRK
jgi:transcriptional regulator with XRE-family HTH domain